MDQSQARAMMDKVVEVRLQLLGEEDLDAQWMKLKLAELATYVTDLVMATMPSVEFSPTSRPTPTLKLMVFDNGMVLVNSEWVGSVPSRTGGWIEQVDMLLASKKLTRTGCWTVNGDGDPESSAELLPVRVAQQVATS